MEVNVQILVAAEDRCTMEAGSVWTSFKMGRLSILIGSLAIAALPMAASGQQGPGEVPKVQRPIIILNRDPDLHDLNALAEKNAKKRNFDEANMARKRAIEDETNKLLILARDLQAKTEKQGSGPLPRLLVREAEVIEFLANDVKQKMKLTVGAD